MQVEVSEMTACLVIVVPGGANHVRFAHPQGFNLKLAACFTEVSILIFKGNRGRSKTYSHWFRNSQE